MASDDQTIDAEIQSADPATRRTLKRQLFAQVASLAGQSWSPPNHPAFTATITDGPSIDDTRDCLTLTVTITRNGNPFFEDEFTFAPLRSIGVLFPDPAGTVTRGSVTYRVDPRAVLVAQLKDALRIALGLG